MLHIQDHFSLAHLNTFGIKATARHFVEINDLADLLVLIEQHPNLVQHALILGGGSNILFTSDYDGLVIKNNLQGIELIREDDDHVWIKAGAGVNWHQFVMYCVENNYAGLENLSLIPGTVGAAPMQNIGAYGVEIEHVFESLNGVNRFSGESKTFYHTDCQFGYRESIFKKAAKGQYIISNVTFRLDKNPTFHTSYGAIQDTLNQMGIESDQLSIKAISDAVIQIRQSKLPNPTEIGNAGSFFKNPEIPRNQYETLRTAFPTMPGYVVSEDLIKVPAGWLIEQAGWKGKRSGDAGVHFKQALVLVNYGNATGVEILDLAHSVQQSVFEKFGIPITPEVNLVP